MKYMVITSKHHDGFALFDSRVSDYDVVDATPYGKDILAQLKAECDKQGISFNTYYSILDWHHPAQYVNPEAENPRAGHAKNAIHPERKEEYIEYMKAQLKEILDNYDVGVLWFDGEWQNWWNKEDGHYLYNWLRNLKPSLIINNRIGAARAGSDGFDTEAGHAGDFGTPEQKIPDTGLPGVDWESCMTMNDTWGYKYFDDHWKSTETLLRNLVDIVSKGGNYLLNVGPKADGTIPEESIIRLQEIGEWMAVHGEAIYGTSAGPFDKPDWGRYAQKPGVLYVFVFDWPQGNSVTIPLAGGKMEQLELLGDADAVITATPTGDKTGVILQVESPILAPQAVSVIKISHTAEL